MLRQTPFPPSFVRQFQATLFNTGFGGCQLYTKSKGNVELPNGGLVGAHRVALSIESGIPLQELGPVRQTCGNKKCCAVEHLMYTPMISKPVERPAMMSVAVDTGTATTVSKHTQPYLRLAEIMTTMISVIDRLAPTYNPIIHHMFREFTSLYLDNPKTWVPSGASQLLYSLQAPIKLQIKQYCTLHGMAMSEFQRIVLSLDILGGL